MKTAPETDALPAARYPGQLAFSVSAYPNRQRVRLCVYPVRLPIGLAQLLAVSGYLQDRRCVTPPSTVKVEPTT